MMKGVSTIASFRRSIQTSAPVTRVGRVIARLAIWTLKRLLKGKLQPATAVEIGNFVAALGVSLSEVASEYKSTDLVSRAAASFEKGGSEDGRC